MELSKEAQENLSKIASGAAKILSEAVDETTGLVRENAKELVREVVLYHGIVGNAFSVLAALSLAAFTYFGWTHAPETGDGRYWAAGACLTLAFGTAIWVLCSVQDAIKAIVAPRLFLIEYAADLLKKDDEK
jgi:hypothetical protein